MTLPTVAGNFRKTDNDGSLWIWSQISGGARGMWSSHCPGHTSVAINHAVSSHCSKVQCSDWKVLFFQTDSCYLHKGTCSDRPSITICPVSYPYTSFSLAVEEGSNQTLVSLKQPLIKLFNLGSNLLFVFIHWSVVRVISWNFSLSSLQSLHQNLDWKECNCGAFLDVLQFVSHRDHRWDKEI